RRQPSSSPRAAQLLPSSSVRGAGSLHNAGLATLKHASSPMGFLKEILDRPENVRPFLLIPVGYPAEDAEVPQLEKKALDEIADFRLLRTNENFTPRKQHWCYATT